MKRFPSGSAVLMLAGIGVLHASVLWEQYPVFAAGLGMCVAGLVTGVGRAGRAMPVGRCPVPGCTSC